MTNKSPHLKFNDQKFETLNHSVLCVPMVIGFGVCFLESKNRIYGS